MSAPTSCPWLSAGCGRGLLEELPVNGAAWALPQGLQPPDHQPSPAPALSLPTALSDPAAKENCMMHLLRSLPDPNLITFLFLLEHLKR